MKVLMVIGRHADTRTLNEARALVGASNEVTVLAWDRKRIRPKEEVVDGVRVCWIGRKETYGRGAAQIPGFASFWFRALFRLLTWECDVIQCENLDALPFGWFAARLRGKRLVFDAHIPYPDRVARLEQRSRLIRIVVPILEIMERTLAKRADILLTDSEKMVERFKSMGVKKAFEILNVPEADFSYTAKKDGTGPVTVGRIGLISRDMGQGADDTIDAFEQLLDDGYDVRLVLIGDMTPGSYKDELTARLRRFGDRATFSDYVPYSQVIEWYGKLDISLILYDMRVHRCMYRLGYPTKLFESMAAGVPIVLRSNDHAQQLLLDNDCGLVVGYALDSIVDALRKLIEDPQLRARYGANGRRMFEQRYNWAIESQRLLRAYDIMFDNKSDEPRSYRRSAQ